MTHLNFPWLADSFIVFDQRRLVLSSYDETKNTSTDDIGEQTQNVESAVIAILATRAASSLLSIHYHEFKLLVDRILI